MSYELKIIIEKILYDTIDPQRIACERITFYHNIICYDKKQLKKV